jgi:DNA invertase Pin-like site-specific DNA recombinase
MRIRAEPCNAPACAAYIRVSSRTQDHATQRSAIERAAGARGDAVMRWYAEKLSGKTMARSELQRLRDDSRAGLVRRLYVFRLDRLTRSGIRDTFELVEQLRGSGVEIITVADGFDMNGPAAEVVVAVMAWAAKMERIAINERIAASRERLASEGRAWGRPSRVDPAMTERARAMRAEGRSVRAIAMALKVPRSTIGRALASQKHDPSEDAESASVERGQQGAVQ